MIHEIDAIGLLCPLPVLKARKALNAAASGDEVHILANDPVAVIDIPHFCQQSGHHFIEMGRPCTLCGRNKQATDIRCDDEKKPRTGHFLIYQVTTNRAALAWMGLRLWALALAVERARE